MMRELQGNLQLLFSGNLHNRPETDKIIVWKLCIKNVILEACYCTKIYLSYTRGY